VTLPSIALIKMYIPRAKISVLVPEYTKEIADRCPYIDEVVVDPGRQNGLAATLRLASALKKDRIDAVITFFSTSHTGLAVWLARIPYRLAPATKIAQLAYNHRLKQRRSRSTKPEYQYNLDLAKKFLADMGIEPVDAPVPPYLSVAPDIKNRTRLNFYGRFQIPESAKLIFVHAGSGGSSNNLSLEQYARLIHLLDIPHPYHFVLSAGPGELDNINRLSSMIHGIPHTVYDSREGLGRFLEHISLANLFIGGSTGPLHIAGALDIPTAAFYVRLKTSSALRWQTINSPQRRLAFSPPDTYGEDDMSGIDLDAAAKEIKHKFVYRSSDL